MKEKLIISTYNPYALKCCLQDKILQIKYFFYVFRSISHFDTKLDKKKRENIASICIKVLKLN